MNYELLKEHIEVSTYMDSICPQLKKDGFNAIDFYKADVVGNRRFAQNYGGYPRSEIAEINAAATMQEQMNLLSMLNDYTPSDNPNAGLSDAEIMLSHKSKYQQCATELQSWIVDQINVRDARLSDSKKPASPDTIEFKNDDEPKVD